MIAYFVYTWSGEYEQYDEYDQKYFLHEKDARDYEKQLEEEKQLNDAESYIRYRGWYPNATEDYIREQSTTGSGVCFEEIEIIEKLAPSK